MRNTKLSFYSFLEDYRPIFEESNWTWEKLALRKLIPGGVDKVCALSWRIEDLLPTRCQCRGKKPHHIKRRQVTEKVWMEAMVIIIYIGPSDISRTKWRACKTGFNSLLSVQDQMPAFSEMRMVPHSGRSKEWQTSTSAQKQHRWACTALTVTELYPASLALIINSPATVKTGRYPLPKTVLTFKWGEKLVQINRLYGRS